jgi:hypothetical protein
MHIIDDVRTNASDITEYLNCWLDHFARSHGKTGHSALDDDEQRDAVRELCGHMYENLSILDSKSSALIASNGLATAILSVLALASGDPADSLGDGGVISTVSLFLLVPSLVALILNVSVLLVYWSTSREIAEHTSVTDRARSLIRIRNERTRRYRLAFFIHMFVLVVALSILVLVLLKRIPA